MFEQIQKKFSELVESNYLLFFAGGVPCWNPMLFSPEWVPSLDCGGTFLEF